MFIKGIDWIFLGRFWWERRVVELFKQSHPCWLRLAVSADSGEAHRFKCSEVLRQLFLITGSVSIAPARGRFLWKPIEWMSLQGAQPRFAVSQSLHPSEEWTSVKIYNSSFKLHLNTCPTFYKRPDKQLLSSRRYIRCARILLGNGFVFYPPQTHHMAVYSNVETNRLLMCIYLGHQKCFFFSSDHGKWKC